jgi:multidrug efflux system membrane fusion protein
LKAGNIVKANDTSFLVTINQIHPIYVSLSVPQRDFTELRSAMAAGTVEAAVQLPGDDKRVEKGQVAFVDNAIDVATGTITVKAVFPNDHEALWPGQFVNIMLTLRVEPEAVVVPTPAVQIGQNGSFVFVVKPDQTAEVRSVETSRTLGNETVIAKGLQPGEQVIVDGQLRVTNGTKVEPRPRGEPKKEGLTS